MSRHPVAMTRTRAAYVLAHRYFRMRLNAGGRIDGKSSNRAPCWQATEVARQVVLASGREPAPVFTHALHYQHEYIRRAKAIAGSKHV